MDLDNLRSLRLAGILSIAPGAQNGKHERRSCWYQKAEKRCSKFKICDQHTSTDSPSAHLYETEIETEIPRQEDPNRP
jgi:hypothetical protein